MLKRKRQEYQSHLYSWPSIAGLIVQPHALILGLKHPAFYAKRSKSGSTSVDTPCSCCVHRAIFGGM